MHRGALWCAGLGALAVGLLGWGLQLPFAGGDEGVVHGMLLATFAGVAFAVLVLGVVFGVLALPRRGRPGSGVGLTANLLVGVVLLVVAGGQLHRAWRLVQREVGRAEPADAVSVASRPIPVATGRVSDTAERVALSGWMQRMWTGGYAAHGRTNPVWDAALTNFFQRVAVQFSGGGSVMLEDELQAERIRLEAMGCNDPAFLTLAGLLCDEVPQSVSLLERAVEQMPGSGYDPLLVAYATAGLAFAYSKDPEAGPKLQATLDLALTRFKEALRAGALPPEQLPVFVRWWEGGTWSYLFERRGVACCGAFERWEACPEWFRCLARGRREINAAWEARGSGWASTVTEEGQRRFRDHLDRARTELTRAVELNPADPVAPAYLIRVAMGRSDDPAREMREWFDRSVSAQLDCRAAYDRLRWGLRRRWHGSQEALLAFGDQCRATGRYDTWVPYESFLAERDAASDHEGSEEFYAMFPDRARKTGELLERYAAEPGFAGWSNMFMSQAVMVAADSGDITRARQLLESVGFQLDRRALADQPAGTQWLPARLAAYTSAAAAEIREGEEAYLNGELPDAIARFENAVSKLGADPVASRYVSDQLAAARLERDLAGGEWVKLEPDAAFLGWRRERGEWSVPAPGVIECRAGVSGFLAAPLARVGPVFEMEADVEIVSTSNGYHQAGVLWGEPDAATRDWFCARLMHTARRPGALAVGQGFGSPFVSTNLTVGTSGKLAVLVADARLIVRVNDAVVVRQSLARRRPTLDEDSRVGLGGFYDQNEVVVRYKNLRVRRVAAQPSAK